MLHHFGKLCPRCKEHDRPMLRWSEQEYPPTVHFDRATGRIQGVSLMRYCICCGYREVGYAAVQAEPVFTELKER